jgi:two-component system LytT family response regulator
MSIRTVIIDDEPNNIENLQGLLQSYSQLQVIGIAETVDTGYELINQAKPDLLFLDIQLHGETGFDLLRRFNTLECEIIFVTAYDQYGIDAIKFSALDYLLKPINPDELKQAIAKASERIQKKQKDQNLDNLLSFIKTTNRDQQKIALPLQNEIRYVPVMTIIRCEASNNYTHVFVEDGESLLVCKTLKEFAGMLRSYQFIRTHQSHLVNVHFVKSYLREDGGALLLSDKTKVPISKAHREEVKEALKESF